MKVPPETRCRFCLLILCCSEHRIAHEIKRHAANRRLFPMKMLSVPNIHIKRLIPIDHGAPRKRKRESILQELASSDKNDQVRTDTSVGDEANSFSSALEDLSPSIFPQSSQQSYYTNTSKDSDPMQESQNLSSNLIQMQLLASDSETPHRYGCRNDRAETGASLINRLPLNAQPRKIQLSQDGDSQQPISLWDSSVNSIEGAATSHS